MGVHILLILLSLGMLSMANGCYFDPYPYDNRRSYGEHEGRYQGQPSKEERDTQDEERRYRKRRRAQEWEREHGYQPQEREDEHDPQPGGRP